MHYLLSSSIGYILGSIPTAYILLKKKRGLDITKTGSGNVGAMNSYEVTNSRLLGLTVLIIDFAKGFLSVFLVSLLYPENFVLPCLSLVFAILSHCFNPWIEFKGGRGLATAAGGSVIIFPIVIASWIILWVIFYLLKKDILIANIAAIVLFLLLLFNTSGIAIKYVSPEPTSENELVLFVVSGLLIIFIKHLDPLKEIIQKLKTQGTKNDK